MFQILCSYCGEFVGVLAFLHSLKDEILSFTSTQNINTNCVDIIFPTYSGTGDFSQNGFAKVTNRLINFGKRRQCSNKEIILLIP